MELNGDLYYQVYCVEEECHLCSQRAYHFMQRREKYNYVMVNSSRYHYYHIPCFYFLQRREQAYEDIRYLFANPNFVPKLFTLSMNKVSWEEKEFLKKLGLPKYDHYNDLYEFQ
jgi:hypothetical protein